MNLPPRFSVLSLLVLCGLVISVPCADALAVFAPPAGLSPPPPPPPPADPSGLTVFTLDNGLTVWLHPMPEDAEPAQVGVALVLAAGPVHEDDDQIGAAYLAKRASGLGTAHAPVAALERLRSGFGGSARKVRAAEGGHATLTHEGVVHTLVFDADDADARATALGHFADLLSAWTVDAARLAGLRRMASDRIAGFSPEERARHAFVPELFEGQLLGRRPLIPDAEALEGTDAAAVDRFIRERYRPDRATLVVVGRFDVGDMIHHLRVSQRDVPARPSEPSGAGPAIDRSLAGRVAAVTVPGYTPAEVALLTIEPAGSGAEAGGINGDAGGGEAGVRDPNRRAVLDAVAAELVGARVRTAAALGDAGVVSVETGVKEWIGGSAIAEVSVRGEQAGLDGAGRAVAAELARIHADGFTTDEVRAARAAVLAGYERDAVAWRGADAGRVLDGLVDAARARPGPARGAGWLSPVERAGLASVVLASTTDAALVMHARRAFEPSKLACVLIGSEPEPALTESGARGVLAVARAPSVEPARAVPESLMAFAREGAVATISNDPTTGVWSGLLGNGVLVRVKRVPGSGVRVRAVLCDGPGREDASTLGRTRDAVAAWAYPAIGAHDAGAVRAWSLQRGLRLRPAVFEHSVVIEVDGEDAGSAPDALALVASLLASPGTDAAYARRVRAEEKDYGPALRRFTELMFEPGEARARTPGPADGVDAGLVDAWLTRLAVAPIEVSVVGDILPEDALRLAAQTLGGLPRRDAPSRARPGPWGPVPRAETLERVPAGADGRGQALVGIVFGDATDLDRVRPVLIAAGAIGAELEREIAGGRLDASARAWVWLGDGIPDRATLVVWCDDAADPEAALRAIDAAIERVAAGDSDPSVIEKEIERARRSVERAWASPAFWSDRLSRLSSQGLDIGSVAGMPGSYGSITVQGVRDTLRGAVGAGIHKRVIAVPAAE